LGQSRLGSWPSSGGYLMGTISFDGEVVAVEQCKRACQYCTLSCMSIIEM
jgi:hypothetical protein